MNAKELQRYRATRSHCPLIPAATILRNIKSAEPAIPLRDFERVAPYGPRIVERVGYSQREVLTSKRWIENTYRAGLRFVGYADDIAPRAINHRGWYTDDDIQDEVIRGAVWQLPARNGRAQYVAGYEDANNKGAALIDFDVIEGEHGGSYPSRWCDTDSDARTQAAHAADSIAQHAAEIEREYNRKWQAARLVEDYKETLCLLRRDHTAAVRAVWTGIGDDAIATRMRQRIRNEAAQTIRNIRETIAEFGDEILTEEFA